ncbi:MAG: hypothetical protein MKZ83_05825, partial [Candidatus Poseidoniia archaeon]|nr:hypothetical protein [Candidatus Poseidoniia archaeon]
DQRAICNIFRCLETSKVRADLMVAYKLLLGEFSYTIKYRPGSLNPGADGFSRLSHLAKGTRARKSQGLASTEPGLVDVSTDTSIVEGWHRSLGHVGVVRLWHLLQKKNVAVDLSEVKRVCRSCTICKQVKPKYFKSDPVQNGGATQPLEKLTLSVEGPILGADKKHKFLLSVVDAYSQFVWGYSMPDKSDKSIMHNLTKIFSLSGAPSYVSEKPNRGTLTPVIKQFINSYGAATSKIDSASATNGVENEKFYGSLWRTIQLLMADAKAPMKNWHLYLLKALQAKRTLLDISANAVPHEKLFTFSRQVHDTKSQTISSWLSDHDQAIFKDDSVDPPLAREVDVIQKGKDSAQITLPDGQMKEVKTELLYPLGEGATERPQDQPVIDLVEDSESIDGFSDAGSEIRCPDSEKPPHSEPETDPNYGGTSPKHTPVTTRRPIIIPFSLRPMQDQNQREQSNLPNDRIASSKSSQYPDSPPLTRLRAQQESMELRSGKTLPLI